MPLNAAQCPHSVLYVESEDRNVGSRDLTQAPVLRGFKSDDGEAGERVR